MNYDHKPHVVPVYGQAPAKWWQRLLRLTPPKVVIGHDVFYVAPPARR